LEQLLEEEKRKFERQTRTTQTRTPNKGQARSTRQKRKPSKRARDTEDDDALLDSFIKLALDEKNARTQRVNKLVSDVVNRISLKIKSDHPAQIMSVITANFPILQDVDYINQSLSESLLKGMNFDLVKEMTESLACEGCVNKLRCVFERDDYKLLIPAFDLETYINFYNSTYNEKD
jgi:hypothetical protein